MTEESKIPPDQLIEINNLVDESYANPQSNDIQQLALRSCLRFLSKLGDDAHIFCNPQLEKAALKSFVIFAYPNTHHLAAYQSFLANQLASCPLCPRKFHLLLIDFEKVLSETFNYDEDTVDELMKSIELWNQQRILAVLESMYNRIKEMVNPKPNDFRQNLITVFECLCAPRLLRDNPLRIMFKNVFFGIQSPSSPSIRPPDLLPGVISFLFSSDKDEHTWAELTIKKMKEANASTAESFDAMLVQAIDDVVEEASTKQSEEYLRRFWYIFSVLLRALDKSVFLERLSGRQHDIVRFLAASVLKLPKLSLPATLSALGKLLEKLGSSAWPLFTPITVEYLVNAIRGNVFFSDPIPWAKASAESLSSEYGQDPKDMVDWVVPLLKSCDSTTLQRCGQVITPLLLEQALRVKGRPEEELLLAKTWEVISLCLHLDLRDSIPFASPVSRLQRASMKQLCYHYAPEIFRSYSQFKLTNVTIPGKALEAIYSSVLLDVLAGTPDTPGLKDSALSSEEEKETLTTLWTYFNQHLLDDSQLAINILRAIQFVPFIARPPPRRPEETRVMPRGKISTAAVSNAATSMRLIGEFDSINLIPVLKNDEALLSIILNTFSANQDVNQSAVDVICQTFDTDDRLSGLSALLNFDLKRTLHTMSRAIKKVNDVYVFPPYPKLIKVAQDMSQCLFGAKNGILHKNELLSPGPDNELYVYWHTNWKFLAKTFRTTPKWATYFKNDFMLEFMRDLLDYSGELVDYFRLVESLIPANVDASTGNNFLLLNPVIDCLTEMCRLLRLKDESLILSCFNIIVTVLGLMKSFNVKPSQVLVNTFTQLASKARGFENVLTTDQLIRLLVDCGAFTMDEAEKVMRPSSATTDSDSTPPPDSDRSYSRTSANRPVQRSILDFARPGRQALHGQSVPTVVKTQAISGSAPRTSMMDTLRQEVKSSRSVGTQAVPKEIHPARPPGFNSNPKFGRASAVATKAQATTDSSDDESSDGSDNDGLFTVKKVIGTHKMRNIERHSVGTIGTDTKNRRIFARDQLSEQEREERNMRARLQINMNPLYEQILSWDYHSTSDKPHILKTGKPFDAAATEVPDKFTSVEQYQKVFEPLLMLECWQGIQRSKMEGFDKPFKITVASKILVGNAAYEIRASVASEYAKDMKLSEADLLVLSYFDKPSSSPLYPSKSAPYCFAKIKEIKNSYAEYAELSLRVEDPPINLRAYLTMTQEFHALKATSMTTIEREYCSLKGLPYYDLQSDVLNALPSSGEKPSSARIEKTVNNYNVNVSQAKAIISSLSSPGFSLIQGYVFF